jgi:hypothetical protein
MNPMKVFELDVTSYKTYRVKIEADTEDEAKEQFNSAYFEYLCEKDVTGGDTEINEIREIVQSGGGR